MKFKDFVEKRKRICEHYSRCSSGCPLYPIWCFSHNELTEKIVDRWEKDNPILTNGETK